MDSIYPPRYLALAFMYAGHVPRKWVAVSISPHLSQRGLLDIPMVWRCLLRVQCLVSTPVNLLMFRLLSHSKNLIFLSLIWIHFLACSALFTVTQCSLKVRFFQVEIMLLRYEYDTLILGSGPMNGVA